MRRIAPARRATPMGHNRRLGGAVVAQLVFGAQLQSHVACPPLDVPSGTVRGALEAAFAVEPRLERYVLDDQGRLRRHVAVFVGGRKVADTENLTDPVGDDDEVFVVQALSGG